MLGRTTVVPADELVGLLEERDELRVVVRAQQGVESLLNLLLLDALPHAEGKEIERLRFSLKAELLVAMGVIQKPDQPPFEKLDNGEPIDPPQLVLEDYNLGAVNWTPLGPSIFKPQMSNNGIRQPADAGTFLYDGSGWRRYSLHEVLDAVRNGPVLLAAELTGSTDRRGGGVVIRIGTQETRWTPVAVSDETPLALLDDGRVLAWRAGSIPFRGQLVSYRDGKQIAADIGAFAAFANIRAGIFGEWILGQEFSGAPSLRVHSYSISAHAFASIDPSTTAVGAIVVGVTHR